MTMFCVVQEVRRRKPNKHGAYKELAVFSFPPFTIGDVTKPVTYRYEKSGERFERPVRKAYKVSIHESKRINGVVTKKQFAVTTLGYYELAEYPLWDCFNWKRLTGIANELGTDIDRLSMLIEAKIEPLRERILEEYSQTDEYKTVRRHEETISAYREAKKKFADDYGCSADEYDYCFDVFGNLMNRAYLDGVVDGHKKRSSYHKQERSNYSHSGESGDSGGDWSWDDFKKYLPGSDSYTDADKTMLKKFYRSLSKEYHPDANLGKDTTWEMQLLNRLKDAWGV